MVGLRCITYWRGCERKRSFRSLRCRQNLGGGGTEEDHGKPYSELLHPQLARVSGCCKPRESPGFVSR
jgi:hypothetical protein